jgi:predicted  nucleic acid-binding Zn-ribbon protein
MRAELIEWQARCADLSNSLERMREERDAARASVDLLWGDIAKIEDLYQMMKEQIDKEIRSL